MELEFIANEASGSKLRITYYLDEGVLYRFDDITGEERYMAPCDNEGEASVMARLDLIKYLKKLNKLALGQ